MGNLDKNRVAEKLAGLQQAFKDQLPGMLGEIERIWTCLPRGEAQGSGIASLNRIILALVELAEIFGADGLLDTSGVIEKRLSPFIDPRNPMDETSRNYIDSLLSRLSLEAAQWQPGSLPASRIDVKGLSETGRCGVVLLVGDDEQLFQELTEAGYRVRYSPELSAEADVGDLPHFSVILICHSALADRPMDAIQGVSSLWEKSGCNIPVLLASNVLDMETCLAAVRKGPIRFTRYPPDISSVRHDLEDLLPHRDNRYRVLLCIENELLQQYYELMLHSAGMRTNVVKEPGQVLNLVENFRPDLILADASMTACASAEFQEVIHSTPGGRNVPVVFLSRNKHHAQSTEAGEIFPAIFLDVPVSPERLVEEIIRLIHVKGKVYHLGQELAAVRRDRKDLQRAMDQHAIVSITDVAGHITHVNDRFCEISGYSEGELLGNNHRILKSGLHDKVFYQEMWDVISNGGVWQGEICNRRKNGEYYWVEATIMPLMGEDRRIRQYISLRTDITRIKEDELNALETSRRLKSQQELLVRLAAEPALNDQDPELFFRHLTRYTAENMGVGRVSLWIMDESRQSLVCRMLYQARGDIFSNGQTLDLESCPSFITELKSHRSLIVDDVHNDSAVRELLECYLCPEEIGAVLCVPVLRKGEMVGALCIEYVGRSRQWKHDECSFASALAALAAQRLEILQRIEAETIVEKQKHLLTLLNSAMTEFIANQEIEQVTEHLLKGVLELTGSAYGFAGEIQHRLGDVPEFKLHALTLHNHESSRESAMAEFGVMRFHNLDTLFGETIKNGQVVISNDPEQDHRHRGLPEGHPPLKSYLGMPIYYGNVMVAMYSLANRSFGYDQDLIDFLQPFNTTYGVLVEAARIKRRGQMAQQALLEAKEEADNANRAKSQFLSNMSHELRTPLNAIMGFGQLLQMDREQSLSATQRDCVEEILSASQHLLDLINEVLDLTRIEIGRVDLNMQTIDVVNLIDECMGLISPQAQERGIDVRFSCQYHDSKPIGDEKGEVRIRADRTRLKQALLNLLSNAIKYNKEGGQVDIICSGGRTEHLHITISDTGHGIPREKHSQIFQAFNRLGVEQTEIEGTGIGLVITRKLIELMGGAIGFESEEGKGSTFWFEIPLARQAESQGMHAVNGVNTVQQQIQIKKIVYIEDNAASIRLVSHLLGLMSHVQLLTAQELREGLSLVEKHQPALVLLNINLLDMEGGEALAVLHKQLGGQETPVIAVGAGIATAEDVEMFREIGFLDYITKPIETESLIRAINRALLE